MSEKHTVWQKSRVELFRDLNCGEDGLDVREAAARLDNALDRCTVKITGQTDGATCQEYGDAILDLI